MSIRRHPSKTGFWQIIISQGAHGKQIVIPIECDEVEARRQDKLLNDQIKGRRPEAYPTIIEALTDYLTYYRTIATEDVVKDALSIFRRELLPHFGRFRAHQIVPTMVYAYTAKRLGDTVQQANGAVTGRTVSHRTIHKELNHLSAMCRWLHLVGMAEKIPVIPKPPKAKTQPKRQTQPLTLDELNRLLAATPEEKRVLLLLMSDAGLRCDETLTLKTADINLTGGRMTVRGKGGKVVVYPILTERLSAALSASLGEEYLTLNSKTGKPFESIKTLLNLAAKRAGITKPVTHHVLRHTFSNLLMECGIATEVRQLLMRHSSLSTTQKYTRVSAGFLTSQSGNFTDMVKGASESLKIETV
jgi:site-specific recombinase XerD